MCGGMDMLQLLDGDLGINLGGREFGMAKELLDKADIQAAFQHEGGAGMAEQVAGAAFAQFRRVDVVAARAVERLGDGSNVLPAGGL